MNWYTLKKNKSKNLHLVVSSLIWLHSFSSLEINRLIPSKSIFTEIKNIHNKRKNWFQVTKKLWKNWYIKLYLYLITSYTTDL